MATPAHLLPSPASDRLVDVREPGRTFSWSTALRAALASLGLIGLTVASLGIVIVADDRRSILSPPSHGGFPGWMSGPLGGLLPHLTHSIYFLRAGLTWAGRSWAGRSWADDSWS